MNHKKTFKTKLIVICFSNSPNQNYSKIKNKKNSSLYLETIIRITTKKEQDTVIILTLFPAYISLSVVSILIYSFSDNNYRKIIAIKKRNEFYKDN